LLGLGFKEELSKSLELRVVLITPKLLTLITPITLITCVILTPPYNPLVVLYRKQSVDCAFVDTALFHNWRDLLDCQNWRDYLIFKMGGIYLISKMGLDFHYWRDLLDGGSAHDEAQKRS
jgi:hypothetical protein